MMDVYFWQNMPTHIQSPALIELARNWEGNVHGVWVSATTYDRRKLGWEPPEFPGLKQHTIDPTDRLGHVHKLLLGARDAIHIFSGLDAYTDIQNAFQIASDNAMKNLGLMVEPGIAMGWRGRLRPLRARIKARKYLGKIRLVLAMGKRGVSFYQRAGFSREMIFPYMYQSEHDPSQPSETGSAIRSNSSEGMKLIYVGKFIRRKGLDILIRSLTFCETPKLSLEIIGDGEERDELKRLADQLGVSNAIAWRGAMPISKVRDHLAKADLCVVPSRFEGWGVVVNESIDAGTPVICSCMTTSSELVELGDCGSVFQSEDPKELAQSIDRLSKPEVLKQAAANALAYRKRLTGQIIGQYLHDVLQHIFCGSENRPFPPWHSSVANQ